MVDFDYTRVEHHNGHQTILITKGRKEGKWYQLRNDDQRKILYLIYPQTKTDYRTKK